MATGAVIKKQGDGKYSVRVGNSKYNGLTYEKAQARAGLGETRDSRDVYSTSDFTQKALANRTARTGDVYVAGAPVNQKPSPIQGYGNVANTEPMNAGNIGTQTPLSLASAPRPDINQINAVASSGDVLSNSLTADYQRAQDNAAQAQKDVTKQTSFMDKLLGRQSKDLEKNYNNLQDQYGVNDTLAKLQNANLDYASAKAMYDKQYQMLEDMPVPESFIIGSQTQQQKLAAIDLGARASMIAALQGNLELANTMVDKAMDLKYKQQEYEITAAKFNLDNLKDILTSSEKKEADALSRKYDFQLNELKFTRDQDAEARKIALNALQNGAPQSLARQAMESGDPNVATSLLGGYVDKVAMDYQRAQTANIYSEIDKRAADTAKTESGNQDLLNLVYQYRNEISGSNPVSLRFNPEKVALIQSIRGQITAEYKKAKQLGTLDAGVQRLIETIIPDPGGFSLASFSPDAQVKAIDNFIANQGGVVPDATNDPLNLNSNASENDPLGIN